MWAPRIQVASALIFDSEGRMLMTKRRAGSLRPGLWENPGGKAEHGETRSDALKREIQEELGVSVAILDGVSSMRLDLEVTLIMTLFHCVISWDSPTDAPQIPRPLVADGLEYIDPETAIMSYACAPGTYLYYRDIMEYRTYLRSRSLQKQRGVGVPRYDGT